MLSLWTITMAHSREGDIPPWREKCPLGWQIFLMVLAGVTLHTEKVQLQVLTCHLGILEDTRVAVGLTQLPSLLLIKEVSKRPLHVQYVYM